MTSHRIWACLGLIDTIYHETTNEVIEYPEARAIFNALKRGVRKTFRYTTIECIRGEEKESASLRMSDGIVRRHHAGEFPLYMGSKPGRRV